MFKQLLAVCLLVDNFDKSLAFYRDTLGLKVKSTEGKFADFKLGETSLAIFEKSEATAMFPAKYMNTSGGACLAYQVPDLPKAVGQLRAKGVTIIEEPKATAWGQKVAYFTDPDGHVWELSEPFEG